MAGSTTIPMEMEMTSESSSSSTEVPRLQFPPSGGIPITPQQMMARGVGDGIIPAASNQSENPFCQLKNYEIEKKIGRGQFSVVYRARYKLNNQVVALKKVQVSSN